MISRILKLPGPSRLFTHRRLRRIAQWKFTLRRKPPLPRQRTQLTRKTTRLATQEITARTTFRATPHGLRQRASPPQVESRRRLGRISAVPQRRRGIASQDSLQPQAGRFDALAAMPARQEPEPREQGPRERGQLEHGPAHPARQAQLARQAHHGQSAARARQAQPGPETVSGPLAAHAGAPTGLPARTERELTLQTAQAMEPGQTAAAGRQAAARADRQTAARAGR